MRRKRNAGAPPPVAPQPRPQIVTQERTYSLITPLFGGGAVTGERDEVTIIRGTEIRGHLRFWWRACYGGRYSSVDEMKKEEDRIWGAAATSKKGTKDNADAEQKSVGDGQKEIGSVQIVVNITNQGRATEPFLTTIDEKNAKDRNKGIVEAKRKNKWISTYNPNSGVPQYTAFMLQLTSEEKRQDERPNKKLVYTGIAFTLTISFPKENRADIEGALWAWETFGGIGARTRRGFGSLQLMKIDGRDNTDLPTSSNIVDWVRDRIKYLQTSSEPPVKGKAPEKVPCLLPDMQIQLTQPSHDTLQVWESLIKKLYAFRQIPNGRPTKFARSKWPEAEAVFTLTGKTRPGPTSTIPRKFPRAAFGLPIIFNFIGRSDLQKLSLQGKEVGHDRLSSPLILRPLVYKNSSGKDVAIGLAMVLENFSFPPEGIVLVEQNGKRHEDANPFIDDSEVGEIEPLTEKNILNAFMKYFGGNR